MLADNLREHADNLDALAYGNDIHIVAQLHGASDAIRAALRAINALQDAGAAALDAFEANGCLDDEFPEQAGLRTALAILADCAGRCTCAACTEHLTPTTEV